MQQRRGGMSGRPSGTDGSDFSYRMVVDTRYTKVAKGKSRLGSLIALQEIVHLRSSRLEFFVKAISQVIVALSVLFFASKGRDINRFSLLSLAIGFVSLVIGELGRRRSLVVLLRLYTTASSMAAALSVACLVRNDFFFETLQNSSTPELMSAFLFNVVQSKSISSVNSYELVEIARVLFGVILQLFVIITTVGLVQNMSPKRSS